jgi:phenylalanyl-tRNA synthetase alpha chain
MDQIANIAENLKLRMAELENKRDILRAPEFKQLYTKMALLSPEERPAYGQAVNKLRQDFEALVAQHEAQAQSAAITPIDVTAPFDINTPDDKLPHLLGPEHGSRHPLSTEREHLMDIFARMGFDIVDPRELDDDYHMFGALNFPEGHPARDDYDTFMTEEGLIPPAHTSTMQNRVLKQSKPPIRAVIPGRTFRNEDVDARHDHTFNQFEGVYVDKGIHTGHLISVLQEFLQEYYNQKLETRMQPFYFPFTEPSFEFALSCPFCQKKGCSICGQEGWIELLGCGMIHPNVLKEGGIDPNVYTGFAWGGGIDRLAMMKHNIEDVRNFNSGKLDFLRQF